MITPPDLIDVGCCQQHRNQAVSKDLGGRLKAVRCAPKRFLWIDQGRERVYLLAVAVRGHTNLADACKIPVRRFKVDCHKRSHLPSIVCLTLI